MKKLFPTLAVVMATQPAFADITVQFFESAPKDRFLIENTARCPLSAVVTLDLTGSAGGLIFDVTGSGAGVAVYQPFEMVAGSGALAGLPQVRDGDRLLVLDVRDLAPGEKIAFTIDVDDTTEVRGTMVSGAEITGATVSVTEADITGSGRFGPEALAEVVTRPCASA